MQVPVYKNQAVLHATRAAGHTVRAAEPELFDNGAQNVARIGAQLAQAGDPWAHGEKTLHEQLALAEQRRQKRESVARQSEILLGFERENNELLNGKLDENGKTVSAGFLGRKLKDAEGTARDYYTQGGQLVSKYTAMAKTPEEAAFVRQTLARSFEDSYNRTIVHQLNEERQSADKAAQAFYRSAAGMAGGISTPQDMRAHLDSVYKIADENGQGHGLSAEELQLARYMQANDNVSAAVNGAIINANARAARQVLDGVKKDLLPDDYNRLNNLINKAEQTKVQGDTHAQVAPLYERALAMAQKEPEKLQEEIVGLMRNPASALTQYRQNFGPLEAKGLLEYAKWVQNNLLDSPDTRAGQIKRLNWQNVEREFAAYEWEIKSGKAPEIGNKDMNNPQTVLATIAALDGAIKHHAFNTNDTQTAKQHLAQLRQALGTMEAKPNDTVYGEVVRQANLLSNGGKVRGEAGSTSRLAPMEVEGISLLKEREVKNYEDYNIGGFFLPEEKSFIIEQTVWALQRKNINLLAEDPDTLNLAKQAVQEVAKQYMDNRYTINRNDVMDVQVGENTFKSYGIKPNPNLGIALQNNITGYRYEEINDTAYLVKRDKNNNVLHRQLL